MSEKTLDRPGHETFPTYYDANVQKVISNAVVWAAPTGRLAPLYVDVAPLESLL